MRRLAKALAAVALGAAASLGPAAPAARAEDIAEIFGATRESSDSTTNVACARAPFPATAGALALALDPATEAALAALATATATAHARGAAFVLPLERRPSAEVEAGAAAVTAWQDAFFGSDDDDLEGVWPAALGPAALRELKLAVERGADRLTLHHIVRNDLESGDVRERFYAGLVEPAAAVRAARGGRPLLTIVNTDVDDTVIPNLWDRGRYERGRPYPGALDLRAAQGEFLVVLTARPSVAGMVSGRTREKFVRFYGLEAVEPWRVSISVAPGEMLDILSTLDMGLEKAETLLAQRRLFPECESIFNGDTGQGDWIAALLLRDLDPAGFPYATMHDVRPWSRAHKNLMRRAVLDSPRVDAIYRRALGLKAAGAGALELADEVRLDAALARFRGDLDRALAGPSGRLDAAFLATKNIYVFRNHADLALDLAAAGRLDPEEAAAVAAAAAKGVRFLPANPFGYDDGARDALAARLRALTGRGVVR